MLVGQVEFLLLGETRVVVGHMSGEERVPGEFGL